MNSAIFKSFLLSLLVAGQVNFAYAQTASILPNAKTTFLDSNGKPLVGGKVQFYVPGTTSPKTTWQDSGETIPNTNPVILDGAGRAIILGDGSYRQVVTDRLGNLIWDQATSSTGSGGGGTTATVGDGDAVGTVKPWSGLVAPQAYVFSYGQELARASFPLLFSTITTQQNVGCTSGNATLTGLGDTSQIPVGAPVESICLNAGATVVSTTISTITVSSNAIITTNSSARIFPFGNGDGSTTFNVPDLRGRVIAGRDNMGSVAANRLTSASAGFGKVAALGANGGNQSETLSATNIPTLSAVVNVTVSGNITGTATSSATTVTSPSGAAVVYSPSGASNNLPVSGTFSGSGTGSSLTNNTGGSTPTSFPIIQPTDILNYIIKTIPDSNPNSFFGVASIGGMTGIITCGFGITCAGNNISAISSVVPAPTLTTLGGVFQLACSTHNWFNLIDGTGTFGCIQPNFTDLAGSIATAQIPINTVTDIQLSQGAALSLMGNAANATANKTDITATAASSCVFRENASALACGPINLAASGAVGSSILALANGGCNAAITASNGGVFFSNATQCQLLAGTATARLPLLSGANAVGVWGAFTLPASVTSGGVAYFNSATSMASSALLTANAFMIGGGVGVAPTTVAITGLVLGNGASAPTSYGGAACTNQFIRALSASGGSTCNTVNLTSDVTGTLPIANGGTSQTTVLSARSSSGLNIDEATSTGDANYTILSTDRTVYHTALTAARTDTLPAANSVNAGQEFHIVDFRGVAGATNTITLTRAGSDTINGITSLVAINSQYGAGIYWSDGVSRWTFFPASSGGGGGTVSNVSTAGLATGGPITTTGTVTVTAASQSDQQAGTSAVLAVTPSQQQSHKSALKAWFTVSTACTINGVCSLGDSYNVTSVTRNTTGDYTITFATAFANVNYGCLGMANSSSLTNIQGIVNYAATTVGGAPSIKTTTALRVETGNGSTGANLDYGTWSMSCFGT